MPSNHRNLKRLPQKIVHWQQEFGRHDLPWQESITPYGVWVSEIMLQQTQVATVIDYYRRFMASFPSVTDLAKAEQDDVLHRWSGLGYYARGRNLHKAAKIVVEKYNGEIPNDYDGLVALPGIGRSTAGAILSLAFQNPSPILDGNVKRVLARFFAVEGWPGQTKVAQRLWEFAEALTPTQNIRSFTQGMMDLGATLCTRTKPRCEVCPLEGGCLGNREGNPEAYPGKKPKRNKPERKATFLLVRDPLNRVLLQQRPATGVWGGLWSFPELLDGEDPLDWCEARLGVGATQVQTWSTLRHTFTHFHLDIAPVAIDLEDVQDRNAKECGALWYDLKRPQSLGLAAPVKKLMDKLQGLL